MVKDTSWQIGLCLLQYLSLWLTYPGSSTNPFRQYEISDFFSQEKGSAYFMFLPFHHPYIALLMCAKSILMNFDQEKNVL